MTAMVGLARRASWSEDRSVAWRRRWVCGAHAPCDLQLCSIRSRRQVRGGTCGERSLQHQSCSAGAEAACRSALRGKDRSAVISSCSGMLCGCLGSTGECPRKKADTQDSISVHQKRGQTEPRRAVLCSV